MCSVSKHLSSCELLSEHMCAYVVGIEIKPGKPTKVEQEDGYMIHVSQVCYRYYLMSFLERLFC